MLLRDLFKSENIGVEVSTIDTFQGRDKDVIIYSCTRSSHASVSFIYIFIYVVACII